MKIEFLPALAFGGLALVLLAALPSESNGQASAVEEAAPAALLADLAAQQIVIEENQTKIEEKIAKISEDIRQARIFVSRGGGTKK